MRCIFSRSLRFELVAGLSIALAIPALTVAAESAPALATQTTLDATTRDHGSRTQATVTVAVTGDDGLPAAGGVAIEDQGRQLSSAALNAEGQASIVLDLSGGDHLLRAVYLGDATHQSSTSQVAGVHALTSSGTPDFSVAVSDLTPATTPANTLTAGQSGTAIVTVTPENNSTLTSPMFVSLSCSGLPDEAFCTFTPQIVQILSTTPTACTTGTPVVCPPTSSMIVQTQVASTAHAAPGPRRDSSPIAWAFLLPGALGLAGIAWGGRRRRWLSQLSLLLMVGVVTMLGASACSPRYNYLNHGPIINPATPAGTYTVTIHAQSNNGVTVITHNATMVVTVK